MADLTVAGQYKKYLAMINLPEESMTPIQKIETKRAYYGAWGQLLVLMRDDISALSEQEGTQAMEVQAKEIDTFWKEQL